MKKLFILIIIASACKINAQSFYKGALVFDVNSGLEIYNTKVDVHRISTNKDTVEYGKAGSFHFTFGGEYAVHKNFGIGLRYKGNNFIQGKDTAGFVPVVKSKEFVLQLNYHPVSTKAFDLILGADFGYSKINYTLNDKEDNKLWGSGTYFSLYTNPRLYIGRFGFNMKLSLPFVNYHQLTSNNEDFNKELTLGLKGSPGFGLSFGIQFRFLADKEKAKEKEKPKGPAPAPEK